MKGNWKEQLQTLNTKLSHDNTCRSRPIRTVTDKEWWAFWGIIFSACPTGKGGDYLFRKQTERKVIPDVNFGRKDGLNIMAHHSVGSRISRKMSISRSMIATLLRAIHTTLWNLYWTVSMIIEKKLLLRLLTLSWTSRWAHSGRAQLPRHYFQIYHSYFESQSHWVLSWRYVHFFFKIFLQKSLTHVLFFTRMQLILLPVLFSFKKYSEERSPWRGRNFFQASVVQLLVPCGS